MESAMGCGRFDRACPEPRGSGLLDADHNLTGAHRWSCPLGFLMMWRISEDKEKIRSRGGRHEHSC